MPRPARALCAAAALLAACSSPSFRFMGAAPASVEVDGLRIDVYADGEAAQAIRLGRAWPATAAAMALRGARAVETATGCKVIADTVRADASVMTARIDCGG